MHGQNHIKFIYLRFGTLCRSRFMGQSIQEQSCVTSQKSADLKTCTVLHLMCRNLELLCCVSCTEHKESKLKLLRGFATYAVGPPPSLQHAIGNVLIQNNIFTSNQY